MNLKIIKDGDFQGSDLISQKVVGLNPPGIKSLTKRMLNNLIYYTVHSPTGLAHTEME